MPDRHPDAETLARYLSGEVASDERATLEQHLARCSSCRWKLDRLASEASRGDGGETGYRAVLRSVTAQAGDHLTDILREVEDATARLAELLALPPAEREPALADPRFHLLKLCDLLERAALEAGTRDPRMAVELASLAVVLADRLSPESYGPWLVEDARALANAHLGNAFRVASDLRRSEAALDTAWAHHRRGDEDAYTEALLLSFMGSLRNAQGRYEEAADLLDRAVAIYHEAKDRHLEGKALLKKATALGYGGRFEQAIRVVRQGLSRIDLDEEPKLLVAARHNLVWCLNESGHPRAALEALGRTRRIYLDLGDPTHLVPLRWLEGRIARNLGQLDEAESAFIEARNAFIQYGIGFDAALVSLDLAALYLGQRRHAEVKRLAAEMVPIFESRDVHQEAIAALLVFRAAAEAERVTASLVERLTAFLTRARSNPELRFDAEG